MTVLYFSCVIVPIALLVAVLGAVLAVLIALGQYLSGENQITSPPPPLSPSMYLGTSENIGTSEKYHPAGGGTTHPFG
jgi:hypothetical protein